MAIDRNEVVCDCAGVTYGEIVDAIKNRGCKTVECLGDETDAGNYCELCKYADEDDVKEYHLDTILKEVLND